ncbi:MAG: hypothetical protein FD143_2138 [Ignavibacteria bacterium]|nr:MAG: hypothetical protein FD143_2138 [Ignavibacteria bacterium]KAF0158908.1 MAG: hypothetical protein FD188_2390 [Ignavibacteria bacterium]
MNKNLTAISLIIFGVGSLLIWSGVLSYNPEILFGIVLTAFGLSNANYSFRYGPRKMIIFSSILFLAGIVLMIKNLYDIIDTRGLVLVSILFISGSAFVIMFIENTKHKTFLFTGVTLALLSIFSLTVLRELGLFKWLKIIGDTFEFFLPVILIFFGVSIYISRKK